MVALFALVSCKEEPSLRVAPTVHETASVPLVPATALEVASEQGDGSSTPVATAAGLPPEPIEYSSPACTPLDALLSYPGCTERTAEVRRVLLAASPPMTACTPGDHRRPAVVSIEPKAVRRPDGERGTDLVLRIPGTSKLATLCESDLSSWEFMTKVVSKAESAIFMCVLGAGSLEGWVTAEKEMLVVRIWTDGLLSSRVLDDRLPDAGKPPYPLDSLPEPYTVEGFALPCGVPLVFRARGARGPW